MTKSANVILKNTLIGVGIVLALVSDSAFRAYKTANKYIQEGISVPFYGMRFVLRPNCYIDGARNLGVRPGWVVNFAPRSRYYGTGVFVSLFGSILASGTPTFVSEAHQQAKRDIENFQQAFAQVDAAIHVGMSFSNAAAILRIQPAMSTNSDSTIDACYFFMSRALEHTPVDWLTNGITLHVSNGIVIRKTYGFTSSR